MNTVTVKINGVEYNLKGKENEKYLLAVAEYVDGKFREISANNNKLSTTAVAVLSALNVADEYFKCELDNEELVKRKNSLEEKCVTLKERLREVKIEYEEYNQTKNEEVDNLKSIICSMEEKLKEVDTLYITIDALKKELELAKEKLQVENKALQDKYEIEKEELKKLFNKEKEVLTESFNKDICELKKSLEEKDDKIVLLNLKNEELQKIEKSLNDELILKEKEIEDNKCNRDEVKNLQNKINSVEKEKDVLRKSFDKDICELKKSLEEKDNKITLLNLKNEELQKVESLLKDKLLLKEKEIEDNKYNSAEVKQLQNKIDSVEKEKDVLKKNNKELKFKLQNSRYKLLDLEKKLNDANFSLAIEKKIKNPLLR